MDFHIARAARPGEVFPYPKGGTFLSLTPNSHVWQCVLHRHWLIATLLFLFARDKISLAGTHRAGCQAGDAKCRFYHSFVPVLMSLVAESCRSRAGSVHLLKPHLEWGKS